jgi:hypothetical protein
MLKTKNINNILKAVVLKRSALKMKMVRKRKSVNTIKRTGK